ncbi:MAG: AAA family ATPase [Clostridia bacterium]|nr:AAA family ATPase [Clostridia bacterium]
MGESMVQTNATNTIAIGVDSFETLRKGHLFYIDKTDFILDWWNKGDKVSLITRPRRFGKTLNMSMMECFFSVKFHERADLFDGLKVWENQEIRREQGTWPVLFLTFANVKQATWPQTKKLINTMIWILYNSYDWMIQDSMFTDVDRKLFYRVNDEMDDETAALSLHNLCGWMEKYYGKKVLIFLDEYDTPMQEAWINGFWDKMVAYMRSLFSSTFKTNPHLSRAIMTGITRISKESIFSDMNNLTQINWKSFRF